MTTFMNTLVLGTVFWPLWGALLTGFGGYYFGTTLTMLLSTSCLFMSCFVAMYSVFLVIGQQQIISLTLFTALELPFEFLAHELTVVSYTQEQLSYNLTWSFLFDTLTVIMLFVVTFVSSLVHLYATSYMNQDPHVSRFFGCLSFFTFFMLMLVTAANYIQLFMSWEGVGLCSYLLITFWYTRTQANKSALQAVMVNKIGDLAFVLALLLLVIVYHDTNFYWIFNNLHWLEYHCYIFNYSFSLGEMIGFLFLVAAMAKSAQIGLHTWLLSAMEGPTPVSALLHAATMVTAGIFLMLRSNPLLTYAPTTLLGMIFIGAITAFFAATCGLVQHDIKKIIAFSTCSQLGYMFYACGLSNYMASLYHLTNHAFFKALLFLCAGAVIHVLQGEQDLRRMGGLVQTMPLTYTAMLLASLSLLGFPFLSGFYSKDILIELAWAAYTIPGTFVFWLATLSAFFTAFYSTRLLFFVFLSAPNGYKNIYRHIHEADTTMLWAFRPLMLGSLFSGYLLKGLFINFGHLAFLGTGFNTTEGLSLLMDSEYLPFYIKIIPVIFSFLGLFTAIYCYTSTFKLYQITVLQMNMGFWRQLHAFPLKKWYFDICYNYFVAWTIYRWGQTCYQQGDQGLLEMCGPQGMFYQLQNLPSTIALRGLSVDKLFTLLMVSLSASMGIEVIL